KRVEQALEILGQGTLDLERAPRHRMLELEPHRVQRLAPEPLEPLAEPPGRLTRKLRTAPVQRITDQRRADARHVHANLMRPAGLERDVDVRVRTKTLADRIARDRRPAMLDDRHFQSIARMPADRRIDRAAAREHALADGRIGPVDLAPLEALREDVLR